MEGDHGLSMAVVGGGTTTTPGSSRWNPTKEQITMLENLYREGIRTPTAEQIQEITGRLQAYGHIEGKNVFYWFQNHKARQRQKQKQENNFAYFQRYLHQQQQPVPAPPLFPPLHPPYPNVVCSPYYMPQPDLGFHPHQYYPKMFVPAPTMKKRLPNECNINGPYNSLIRSFASGCKRNKKDKSGEFLEHHSFDNDQATLELFPMQPTGILQSAKSDNNNLVEVEEVSGTDHDQLYFDFLSGN